MACFKFKVQVSASMIPQNAFLENLGNRGTDGTFSDIYLNYLVGQVLISGSRERGTSRLSLAPHRCCDLQNQEKSWNEKAQGRAH